MSQLELLRFVAGLLEKLGVPWMIVGSHASSFYGEAIASVEDTVIAKLRWHRQLGGSERQIIHVVVLLGFISIPGGAPAAALDDDANFQVASGEFDLAEGMEVEGDPGDDGEDHSHGVASSDRCKRSAFVQEVETTDATSPKRFELADDASDATSGRKIQRRRGLNPHPCSPRVLVLVMRISRGSVCGLTWKFLRKGYGEPIRKSESVVYGKSRLERRIRGFGKIRP